MTPEEQRSLIFAFAAEDFNRGYKQGRQDAIEMILSDLTKTIEKDLYCTNCPADEYCAIDSNRKEVSGCTEMLKKYYKEQKK